MKYAAEINTVLDSFGNCETAQNFNSSRFMKLLKVSVFQSYLYDDSKIFRIYKSLMKRSDFRLQYGPTNEALKIEISYQLFEKSRISMNSNTMGTNFNVFYSLVNAQTDLKEKLKIANRNFAVS